MVSEERGLALHCSICRNLLVANLENRMIPEFHQLTRQRYWKDKVDNHIAYLSSLWAICGFEAVPLKRLNGLACCLTVFAGCPYS